MYSIISNLVDGSNETIIAICGVVLCVLFAELAVMLSKIFRFFMK